MKKTYVVTITLNYDNVADEKELKQAVSDEASSWVDSGSFGGSIDGGELYCESDAELVDYSVETNEVKEKTQE